MNSELSTFAVIMIIILNVALAVCWVAFVWGFFKGVKQFLEEDKEEDSEE